MIWLERKLDRQLPNAGVYCCAADYTERWGCEVGVWVRKLGWLNRLKNSARSSRVLFSRGHDIEIAFETATSKFTWPGPSAIPVGLLPNVVPIPSAPTMGGVVKQGVLK
jgi:hypothetical protein